MMSKYPTSTAIVALAVAAFWPLPAIHAANTHIRTSESTSPVVAADHSAGLSARDIVGQDVQSRQGADLGEIQDLVAKTDTGKIVFALITSGGVAGVGEIIRAVPFAAVQRPAPTGGAIVLDLQDAKWSTAPTMREDEVHRLTADDRGRPLFQYFGREWDDLRDTPGTSDRSGDRLVRVSEIIGRTVQQSEKEVGDIDDVVIDFRTRRGSVLLEPNDDFTGSDQKFVVKFNQLSRSPTNDDSFITSLTRSDFAKATPWVDEGWNNDGGYPYVWTGYGRALTPSSPATGSVSSTQPRVTGIPNVNVVRGALRSTASLPEHARMATITQEGDKLIITGTVGSEALMQKVTRVVEQAADGWTVENKMRISAAAE